MPLPHILLRDTKRPPGPKTVFDGINPGVNCGLLPMKPDGSSDHAGVAVRYCCLACLPSLENNRKRGV